MALAVACTDASASDSPLGPGKSFDSQAVLEKATSRRIGMKRTGFMISTFGDEENESKSDVGRSMFRTPRGSRTPKTVGGTNRTDRVGKPDEG